MSDATPTQQWAKIVRSGKRLPPPMPDKPIVDKPVDGDEDTSPADTKVISKPVLPPKATSPLINKDPEKVFVPPTPDKLYPPTQTTPIADPPEAKTDKVRKMLADTLDPSPTASAKVPVWSWALIAVLTLLIVYLYFARTQPDVNPLAPKEMVNNILYAACLTKIELMKNTLDEFYSKPAQLGEIKRSIKVRWTGLCPKTHWQSEFDATTLKDDLDFANDKNNKF